MTELPLTPLDPSKWESICTIVAYLSSFLNISTKFSFCNAVMGFRICFQVRRDTHTSENRGTWNLPLLNIAQGHAAFQFSVFSAFHNWVYNGVHSIYQLLNHNVYSEQHLGVKLFVLCPILARKPIFSIFQWQIESLHISLLCTVL